MVPARGSGARGVVAPEALVHAVQEVLGQAVPRAGQHLLEADHGLEAQPGTQGCCQHGISSLPTAGGALSSAKGAEGNPAPSPALAAALAAFG